MSLLADLRSVAGRSQSAASSSADVSTDASDHTPPVARRAGRGRRAPIVALAAIVLAALAVVAVLALRSRGPEHPASATGIPPGDTTASVERRTLVERAQVDGTLAFGGALDLYDRLAGTFTWLPAVGAVIRQGGTLYKLDNLPVALMYGSVPAYRALKLGVGDGPDVAQLNANLVALGFDPYGAITAGEHFSEATAAAVRRWQESEGLPRTGEVELGRVIFVSGARRVTAVHVILGQDPPPSSGASKPPSQKQSAAKRKAAKEQSATEQAAKGQAAEAQAAKAQAAKNPAASENGSGAATPELALSTTATRQIVQLQVKATEQQLARVGEAAPVTLPNGDVTRGRITSVGTVATESTEGESEKEKGGSGGNGENATIPVTLTLDHPVARLDKAPVSVELVKSVRRNVLAVPATALVATSGGGYAIQVLAGTHRTELAVTPGMFANGYVQIEGPGVRRGMTVIEPR
jgi:peptidoglycan hydrolase-like protein with peptidoglycan-binding domain